jgi:hypothetical protein
MQRKHSTLHTLDQALKAKADGTLAEWVQQFLRDEGNNALADALLQHKPIWLEMVEFPVDNLKRIEGPEEDPKQRNAPHVWEESVASLTSHLKSGEPPAPLIVTDYWNMFEIADGNHRHEALQRNGVKKYWVIFFVKYPEGKKWIDKVLSNLKFKI